MEDIIIVDNKLQPDDFIRLRLEAGFMETPMEQAEKALANGLFTASASVSYTHLDVYKRQGSTWPFDVLFPTDCEIYFLYIWLWPFLFSTYILYFNPYFHLSFHLILYCI